MCRKGLEVHGVVEGRNDDVEDDAQVHVVDQKHGVNRTSHIVNHVQVVRDC